MNPRIYAPFLYLRRCYWRMVKPLSLGCRAMVIKEGKILLVRLTYYDGWFLPGGGVDRGETFQHAAVREVEEECGLQLRSLKLHGIYLNRHEGKIDHVAVFLSTDFSGEPQARDRLEIKEVRFFPLTDLPAGIWPGHKRRIDEHRGVVTHSEIW